jgi:hypothetical protein
LSNCDQNRDWCNQTEPSCAEVDWCDECEAQWRVCCDHCWICTDPKSVTERTNSWIRNAYWRGRSCLENIWNELYDYDRYDLGIQNDRIRRTEYCDGRVVETVLYSWDSYGSCIRNTFWTCPFREGFDSGSRCPFWRFSSLPAGPRAWSQPPCPGAGRGGVRRPLHPGAREEGLEDAQGARIEAVSSRSSGESGRARRLLKGEGWRTERGASPGCRAGGPARGVRGQGGGRASGVGGTSASSPRGELRSGLEKACRTGGVFPALRGLMAFLSRAGGGRGELDPGGRPRVERHNHGRGAPALRRPSLQPPPIRVRTRPERDLGGGGSRQAERDVSRARCGSPALKSERGPAFRPTPARPCTARSTSSIRIRIGAPRPPP